MKHLLFLLLLSASLSAFSQETKTLEYPPKPVSIRSTNPIGVADLYPRPDTVRAICLVTLYPNGIAHARMGFVVIERGKRPVYLDCRKRALKGPQVGWDFREVNPNVKLK